MPQTRRNLSGYHRRPRTLYLLGEGRAEEGSGQIGHTAPGIDPQHGAGRKQPTAEESVGLTISFVLAGLPRRVEAPNVQSRPISMPQPSTDQFSAPKLNSGFPSCPSSMGLDFSISQMRFIWDKNSVRTVQSPLWIASCSGMEKKKATSTVFPWPGVVERLPVGLQPVRQPLRSRLAAIAAEEP